MSIYIFNWFFLLALFPVAFFWLRRARRILIKRDFSEVALKKGMPPSDPEKYAPYEMALNLIGGILIGTLMHGMPVSEALETYAILTVGDGLVTQIPAVIISIASALLLARAWRADRPTR